jgi:hypothetical protein
VVQLLVTIEVEIVMVVGELKEVMLEGVDNES